MLLLAVLAGHRAHASRLPAHLCVCHDVQAEEVILQLSQASLVSGNLSTEGINLQQQVSVHTQSVCWNLRGGEVTQWTQSPSSGHGYLCLQVDRA